MSETTNTQNLIDFKNILIELHGLRRKSKTGNPRNKRITKKLREEILAKTASRCHVCGIDLIGSKFDCDHVKSHAMGGTGDADNFLPACKTCNNYRWHYLSEEFQWILKIGVWARTEIERGTKVGNKIGEKFLKKEKIRVGRRKQQSSLE